MISLVVQISKEYGCREDQISITKQTKDVIYFNITNTISQDWFAFLTDTGKLKKNSMRLDDRMA